MDERRSARAQKVKGNVGKAGKNWYPALGR